RAVAQLPRLATHETDHEVVVREGGEEPIEPRHRAPCRRNVTTELDAVERQHGYPLGAGVYHERQHAIPRPRTVDRMSFVPVLQRGRVSMVSVRDQERFVDEPLGPR